MRVPSRVPKPAGIALNQAFHEGGRIHPSGNTPSTAPCSPPQRPKSVTHVPGIRCYPSLGKGTPGIIEVPGASPLQAPAALWGLVLPPDTETPRPRVGRSASVYPLVLPSGSAVALLLRVLLGRQRGGGRWSAREQRRSCCRYVQRARIRTESRGKREVA